MTELIFNINVPAKIVKRKNWYLASCPIFDVHSQGNTKKEATKNLVEALVTFFFTCLDMGTFQDVLKQCGFHPVAHPPSHKHPKKQPSNFIDVPLPFITSSKRGNREGCRA